MTVYDVTFNYFCMGTTTLTERIEAENEQEVINQIQDRFSDYMNLEIVEIVEVTFIE